jgi:pyrimidine-specific ribonucleoside hydrolase
MASSARPLIIDTDPGIDDAFALALAARSPEVDLLAVTTVYGNVDIERTSANAVRILSLCGRDDVPVAKGAWRPLAGDNPHHAQYAHGEDGLGGSAEKLGPPARPLAPRPAVETIATILEAADRPVTIAAIGPLTNIAAVLSSYPDAAAMIDRIVVMGGAVAEGNITPAAEFNVWSDPEAARRVLVDSEVAVTVVPLDLTHQAWFGRDWLGALSDSGKVGAALVELTTPYRKLYRKILTKDVLVLHDIVALVEIIWPGTLTVHPYRVDVECGTGPARGALITDRRLFHDGPAFGREVGVAVGTQLETLQSLTLNRLAAL